MGGSATRAALLFAGSGEMRARCRTLDWAATPLGPVEAWPPSLSTAASLVVASAFPMVLLWGETLAQIYNDAYRDLMGAKHPAGLGQPTRECWPEVWQLNAPIYERALAGETVLLEDALFPIDRRTASSQGEGHREEAWFTLSYSPVRDESGASVGVLVTVVETTSQVRARDARELDRERLLADSEKARRQLSATLESVDDAFYAVDADFRFTYVNRRAETLWGRRRETLLGRHYWTEFPQAVGSEPYRRHLEVMADRRPAHFETMSPIIGRWIDVSIYPEEESGGLACYFLDITERKAVEARLREAEERYRALFNAIDQGFCALEVRFDDADRPVDYRFLEVSPSFERQTGIQNGEGRWMREIAPDQDEHWFELYGRVARTGEPVRFEQHSTPLGRWWSVFAFRVGDPELRRVGVLFHDITDRKRDEAERVRLLEAERAARAEAESANRAKSEFLAVMSHELRTPLNAIGGYAELLELGIRGPVNDQQRDDLERIQASQRHLLGLINEVLNYARLETGSVRYDLAEVRVREVLAAAEGLLAPQARSKGLELIVHDVDPGVAAWADADKLRQILVNLLSNAVKFTDRPGSIDVWCEVRGKFVAVEVRDTGVGIPPDKLEAIFEPFVQVRADLTRTAEGTGLGLAISRDLARGMNGDLTVESTLGVGSAFTLTLPRAADGSPSFQH